MSLAMQCDRVPRPQSVERKCPVLVHMTPSLIERLDKEAARIGAENRSVLIRSLLLQGLPAQDEN